MITSMTSQNCVFIFIVMIFLSVSQLWAGTVFEDFEEMTIPEKGGNVKTGYGSWTFGRGGNLNEGLAKIVESKGMKHSKTLSLMPDGDSGLRSFAFFRIHALKQQEVKFWMRVETSDYKACPIIHIYSNKKTIFTAIYVPQKGFNVEPSRKWMPAAENEEGWIPVTVKLDHVASKITLNGGTDEEVILEKSWETDEDPHYQFEIHVRYPNAQSQERIYLDDFSWIE